MIVKAMRLGENIQEVKDDSFFKRRTRRGLKPKPTVKHQNSEGRNREKLNRKDNEEGLTSVGTEQVWQPESQAHKLPPSSRNGCIIKLFNQCRQHDDLSSYIKIYGN